MKKLFLIVFAFTLWACSADNGYNPYSSDSGQDSAGLDSTVRDSGVRLDSGQEVLADSGGDSVDAPADADDGDTGVFNLWPPTEGAVTYHGGPVMLGTVHVYTIWYGNWVGNTGKTIVGDFIERIGGSSWLSITKSYYELGDPESFDGGFETGGFDAGAFDAASAKYVSGLVDLVASVDVGYSHGSTITETDVKTIVLEAIDSGLVSEDPNGLYLVLTSADVKVGSAFSSFCGGYCGYHDHTPGTHYDLKYGFIGDPDNCLSDCSMQAQYMEVGVLSSPNNNWGADAMVSVVAHEIAEAMTDPDINAWVQDWTGMENADKCAWRFEPVYRTKDGSIANVNIGGTDYLIQQNWVPGTDSAGGHCDLNP